MIIRIIYALFLGAWRRAFGCSGWHLPILKNRFCLHLIGFTVTFLALLFCGYHWFQSIVAGLCLFGFYWALGHGPAFDMARDGEPDEKLLKRYKGYFWNKWCEFIVPKESWYKFGYDFLWMLFRYELPAILVAIILLNPFMLLAGFITTLAYAICWGLKDHDLLKKFGPTQLAEILAGISTGLLLTL